MAENGTADDGPPELRESYRACAAEVGRSLPPMRAAAEVLPSGLRPYLHAVSAFGCGSDRVADEGDRAGRGRRFARWRTETLAELAAGRSAHPLRRAFVDTVLRWDLDRSLIEEFLTAMQEDSGSAPVIETFADQRRHIRRIAGTMTELWAPLLGASGAGAADALSALGEACQLADHMQDLPADLAEGRCYLPRAELRRLGLGLADLADHADHTDPAERPEQPARSADPAGPTGLADRRTAAREELMEAQRAHWHALLEQATPATWLAAPACRPFLHTLLLGAQLQYDELALLGSRVLTEGLAPLTTDGALPHRRTRTSEPRTAESRAAGPRVPGPRAAGPRAPGVDRLPAHVAVIMDGNRRWAEARRLPAEQGHQAGQRAALRLVNAALRLGVRHLSIYAFSTENWDRPPEELTALFDSLADGIARSTEGLHALGVRIRWCGRRDRIDESLASSIALVESLTSNNAVLTLTVCADYGGREELAAAARALAAEAVAGTIHPGAIGPADLARHLYVPDLPDVDLLIRTSGEQRISNFLPWHLAYAELLFDPTPWPDYDLARLREAVRAYAARERRFGGSLPAQAGPLRADGADGADRARVPPAAPVAPAAPAASSAPVTPGPAGEGCTAPRP
ncbi:polyprenyl diphosphate synthase [Kitasatospora sp. NPDC056446]|uniref:polyprenyl diphosphate synthase n=1 Tax=Kitasatospora sp. NPDC056446 TaxID=3345819 RepID=UPI00368E41E3